MRIIKWFCLLTLIILIPILVLACAPSMQSEQPTLPTQENESSAAPVSPPATVSENAKPPAPSDDFDWHIRITDTEGTEFWSFNESMLISTMQDSLFAHAYSTINRWPTPRIFAAEGFLITDILEKSGLLDTAQTITFRAVDGYEISLTRTQLFSSQYFFPQVSENNIGAQPVYPIIAFRLTESGDDLGELMSTNPTLIIGQRDTFEQTTHAFVVGVSDIIVDSTPSDVWAAPSTFPTDWDIPIGDTVRLQHPDLGLVHIFYTTDGSEPTPFSTLFNPSVFRPELTESIPITEPTVIKAFARGFGRDDSEIAIFEFTPIP